MKTLLPWIGLFCSLFAVAYCQPTPESQKPVVIFDYCGVVARPDNEKLFLFLEQSLQLPASKLAHVLESRRQARAKGVSEDQFWNQYAAATNTKLPLNWTEKLDAARVSALRPNPKMIKLAQTLTSQGYRVALFSNVPKAQSTIMKAMDQYFDPIVLSSDIGAGKSKKETLQLLFQRLNAQPQKCLLIDDSAETVTLARELDMKGLVFTSVDQLQADLNGMRILELSALSRQALKICNKGNDAAIARAE